MNVLIFGATGMVGQGVLRECLLDPDVQIVQTVGRTPTGLKHPKLRESVRSDLLDYTEIESALRGFDACFFCLGVSSTGMSGSEYERVTYGVTMAAVSTKSRHDFHLRFWRGNGQLGKRANHVGARERQNRKCPPPPSLQGCLHV
jgi:putative NADH-flavin reductase